MKKPPKINFNKNDFRRIYFAILCFINKGSVIEINDEEIKEFHKLLLKITKNLNEK